MEGDRVGNRCTKHATLSGLLWLNPRIKSEEGTILERSTHTLAVKSQGWFVQALFQLIQQKPFEKITISELCKKACLDRCTFYRNFKNKNDVLLFYVTSLQDEYLSLLKSIQDRTFYTLAKVSFEFWTCHLEHY